MISAYIPLNNIKEREYILEILLGEFLGLDYRLETTNNDMKTYELVLENGNKLIIEDHFFNKFPNDLEYLKEGNIPRKIKFAKNDFTPEENVPIIYGNDILKIKNQVSKTIICGIDIFASSFFMLTRWEEYVNKTRDIHNRFPASASLAYKNNFLDRPVVNEYIEMLWNMLKSLRCEQKRKNRKFELVLTHDVDHIYKWNTLKNFLIHLVGDIILRKSLKEFILSLYNYFQMKLGNKKDPFNTFDYLMDVSDELNVKSYFFFMAKGITKYDNNYKSNSSEILSLISNIKQRGHYIGIHPSYNAYNNFEQLKKEKEELEKNLNINIIFGREHYLRFEVPITWQIWEDNTMKWDSTVGYADKEGFRCGVCYEYSIFNILTRKKLKLKEKPLIVMEVCFYRQKDMTPKLMEEKILFIINKIKKYDGEFVLLWHNSNFNTKEWKKYSYIYKKVLNQNV